MRISRLIVSNFRSFNTIDINLRDLNVVIGANASGKSNFIQIFRFLTDLMEFGLDNAVSMQGGPEYLLNVKLGSSQEFSIEVISNTLQKYLPPSYRVAEELYGYEVIETSYNFALNFGAERKRFEVVKDILKQKCKFYIFQKTPKGFVKNAYLGDGMIIVDSSKRTPRFSLRLPPKVSEKDLLNDVFELSLQQKYAVKTKLKSKELFINSPFYFPFSPIVLLRHLFERTAIYDFDARLSKKAQLITGRIELESDGSNLAVVINHLLKNRDRKQKFYNIIGDLLPFVEGFRIQNVADTVLYTILEKYTKGHPLPGFLISDGTINLTSLIVCLFFQENSLKIIEEPERNIHPHLVSRVMDLMKEASTGAQIITTTHNPEVVRHSNIHDLLLVHRSGDGFSTISRPLDIERVRTFLQNEMGIEELYVQNLL